jgi:hypothetical protein
MEMENGRSPCGRDDVATFVVMIMLAVVAALIPTPITAQPSEVDFCKNPLPRYTVIPGKPSLARRPADRVFADVKAMQARWERAPETVTPKATGELIEQLIAMHGTPHCPEAEKLLPVMRRIDRRAANLYLDRRRRQTGR